MSTKRCRKPSLREASQNLREFADMLVVASTEHDLPHQAHFLDMVEAWIAPCRAAIYRKADRVRREANRRRRRRA
jgi:hypothetical protein